MLFYIYLTTKFWKWLKTVENHKRYQKFPSWIYSLSLSLSQTPTNLQTKKLHKIFHRANWELGKGANWDVKPDSKLTNPLDWPPVKKKILLKISLHIEGGIFRIASSSGINLESCIWKWKMPLHHADHSFQVVINIAISLQKWCLRGVVALANYFFYHWDPLKSKALALEGMYLLFSFVCVCVFGIV